MWALPGFLGLPSDWDFLNNFKMNCPAIHDFSKQSLFTWASQFNDFVEKNVDRPGLLIGYSLGGRLALHALIERPRLWSAAVIVSAHPGLKNQNERQSRLEKDLAWSERFKDEKWENLMNSWNSQSVFSKDHFQFKRKEEDYRREDLVEQLLHGSLGRQDDLRVQIAQLEMPILWITGEEDSRFCDAAHDLSFSHPLSRKVMIPDAGHRAPWDQPNAFVQLIETFFLNIQ